MIDQALLNRLDAEIAKEKDVHRRYWLKEARRNLRHAKTLEKNALGYLRKQKFI